MSPPLPLFESLVARETEGPTDRPTDRLNNASHPIASCRFDLLCLQIFKAIMAKADVDPAIIDDVVVGNVRNTDNAYDVRAAALAAGIPETSPTLVVNRFCSSGEFCTHMLFRSRASEDRASAKEGTSEV